MNTLTLRKCLLISFAAGVALSLWFTNAPHVNANPSAFNQGCTTSSTNATTTVTYMTAGTATTTLTCDMQYGYINAADTAALLVYRTASSTASATGIKVEYSFDNLTWFSGPLNTNATTTQALAFSSGGGANYAWKFASSTIGASVNGTLTTDSQVFVFPVPARYVRVIFTVPVGAQSSAIWASIIGKMQNNY